MNGMLPSMSVPNNKNDSSDEFAASEHSFSLALEKKLLYDSDESDVNLSENSNDDTLIEQQVLGGQLFHSQPHNPQPNLLSEVKKEADDSESLFVDICSSPIFILSREEDRFSEASPSSNNSEISDSETNDVSGRNSPQDDNSDQNRVQTDDDSLFVKAPTFSLSRETSPLNDRFLNPAHSSNNLTVLASEATDEIPAEMCTEDGENSDYSCLICNNTFTSTTLLHTHIAKTHMQVEPSIELGNNEDLFTQTFNSHLCNETFKSERDFNSHAHHSFRNKGSLNLISEKKDLHIFSCQLCNLTFETKVDLDNHLTQHKKTIQCPFCNEKFICGDMLLFQKHFETIHMTRNVEKPTKQSEPEHQKSTLVSSNIDILSCDEDLEVSKKQRLQLTCQVCRVQLDSKSKMMSHMLTCHCDESADSSENEDDIEYFCNTCDFQCSNESEIETHCSTHDEYKYQDCDTTLNSKLELNEHAVLSNLNNNVHEVSTSQDDGETNIFQTNHVDDTDLYDDDVETVLFEPDDLQDNETFDDTVSNFDKNECSQEVLCEFCGLLADNKKILETHMKQKHIQITVTYSQTEPKRKREKRSSFLAGDNVTKFNNDVDFSPMLNCSHCFIQFSSLSTLYDHAENEHADINEMLNCVSNSNIIKQCECSLCECSFNSDNYLMAHKLKHRGISKPYLCQLCDRYFTREKYLYYHFYKVHNDSANCKLTVNSFKPCKGREKANDNCVQYIVACSICKVIFSNKFHIFSHYLKEHKNHYVPAMKRPKKRGNFKCDECGNACKTLMGLRLHILRHFHIKSFMCTCCGIFYPSSKQIYEHRKSKNVKMSCNRFPILICNFCGLKTFKSKVLATHIKKSHLINGKDIIQLSMNKDKNSKQTQNDQINYICKFCNSKFNQKNLLKQHVTSCRLQEVIFKNHDHADNKVSNTKKQKGCKIRNEVPYKVQKQEPRNVLVPQAKMLVDTTHVANCDFQQACAVNNIHIDTEVVEQNVSSSNEIYELQGETHAKLEYVHYCNLCSLQVPSLSALFEHAESKHVTINLTHECLQNNGPFKCSLCMCSFPQYRMLMRHELHHKGVLPYIVPNL